MDICEHCHNVLAKTVDRCTVCGTLRADPHAADVRRRESGDTPAHAPGWAAPSVSDGLHPEDFLRELTGEAPPPPPPALPPRAATAPPTGALAGYLGSTIDRPLDRDVDHEGPPPPDPAPSDSNDAPSTPTSSYDEQLTTATKLTPDGVAARSTRLDGSVKIGPTANHTLIALGAPILAAVLVVATVVVSYRVRTSEAAAELAASEVSTIDASAIVATNSAVVRLDLDGCGVVDQATGFLFADQAILAPRSIVLTDDRPTVILPDGSSVPAEIVGWSVTRDMAVIRADQRLTGGLRWGVSGRTAPGDIVSILAITGPGAAAPVPATVDSVDTKDGFVISFDLDVTPSRGSVVLNSDGFVVGIVGTDGVVQVSDDLSPAISRIVLANDRPPGECPPPPTTTTTVPDGGDPDDTTSGEQPDAEGEGS